MSRYHCRIDLNQPDKTIISGHLRLGGQDPLGNMLGVNNYYFTRNDKPFFVISGEFHFSRFPEPYWAEELLKIKAGGVNTVATYVCWICHEEKQGVFEWADAKNLRHFVELCAHYELNVTLRIGPFIHGEWRNGGLPDWLYGQPFEVRSNDPGYLAHVERYYGAIAGQVRGLFFAEGGPIIAIQLENEYMHAGAPWEVVDPWREPEWVPKGRDGVEHLRRLKEIAQHTGLIAPFYLATAWGGASIIEDETLPVYAEYAYPTWIEAPGPSGAYLFRDRHALPVEQPTHQTPRHYPFITAEQQGGIQITYRNRPIVPARSTEAMALVFLGSGSNALGYYMYHGGTTPPGGHGFSQERTLPQLSYDFQAPLGEYGQVRDSYRYLKLLHLFLEAYGETLAPMGTLLPAGALAITPTDTTTPRYCARMAGGSGFLLVNNFQDHVDMPDFTGVVFELDTPAGIVSFPERGTLTIIKDTCFVFPFNQSLQGARLIYATAQPLTVIHKPDYSHYFYFAPEGIQPEFCFDQNTLSHLNGAMEQMEPNGQHLHIWPKIGRDHHFSCQTDTGRQVVVTTLTRQEAEYTWKGLAWGDERVIVCEAGLIFTEGGVQVNMWDTPEVSLTVFPPVKTAVGGKGAQVVHEATPFGTRFHLHIPPQTIDLQIEACGDGKYMLKFPAETWRGVADIFLHIDYEGDIAMAFVEGRLIADHFCNGLPWIIGLKRFRPDLEKGICLVFRPLRQGTVKNVSSNVAARFQFEGVEKLMIRAITALPQYSVRLMPDRTSL